MIEILEVVLVICAVCSAFLVVVATVFVTQLVIGCWVDGIRGWYNGRFVRCLRCKKIIQRKHETAGVCPKCFDELLALGKHYHPQLYRWVGGDDDRA